MARSRWMTVILLALCLFLLVGLPNLHTLESTPIPSTTQHLQGSAERSHPVAPTIKCPAPPNTPEGGERLKGQDPLPDGRKKLAETPTPATFAALVDEILYTEFSPDRMEALYDPTLIYKSLVVLGTATDANTLVDFYTASELVLEGGPLISPTTAVGAEEGVSKPFSFPAMENLNWNMGKRGSAPSRPRTFADVHQQLKSIKTFLSVGLGRMHRDSYLESLYQKVRQDSPAKLQALQKLIRSVVHAYMSYLHTLLQLLIDGVPRDKREVDLLKELRSLQHAVPSSFRSGPASTVVASAYEDDIYVLDYGTLEYDKQPPKNGKFWNMIRPILSCSTLLRLCEQSDGCRLVCNAPYLVGGVRNDGRPASLEAAEGVRYLHFVGFGSNNEYEWEESLFKLFFPERFQHGDGPAVKSTVPAAGRNRIGSLTTLDCTLKEGKFRPPEPIAKGGIGMGTVGKCVDEKPSDLSMTFRELRAMLKETAVPSLEEKQVQVPSLSGAKVTIPYKRYQSSRGEDESASLAHVKRVAILKIDIEGYEFVAVPRWLRDELADHYRRAKPQKPATAAEIVKVAGAGRKERSEVRAGVPQGEDLIEMPMLDFFDELNHFLPVDILQMEFHRMGHKGPYGASVNSALHSHLFLLNMMGLGFIMVGQERNHIDNCCYEFSFVHYRYFIESELWMLHHR